jgi:hypothetical protein
MDRRSARLWLLAAIFAVVMVYLEVSTRPRRPTPPEPPLPSDAFIEIE